MKKTILITLTIIFSLQLVRADEGMWIPMLLGELNEAEMQAMGMKLSAEDIYSINHSSLKDAVLIFGGGCTAEIVSNEGLILTNHHCGFSRIQQHSSLEHDYLKDGFWAMSKEEELPNPGLTVTRLVRMEDVSQATLENVSPEMTEEERQATIKKNIKQIVEKAEKGTSYKALVKPFFYGNQYFLFVNEIFKDIRLVGAPPSNIGKFGGDTDNWVWPRHTGDFSIFRIYSNDKNKPAEYDKNNKPYTPVKHFNISLKGAHEDDFTFVYGYPGTTEEYLPASAMDLKVNIENPIRIKLRNKRLQIIKKYMDKDPELRIQYSAKQAGIANGWKKWIGENLGIKKTKALLRKQEFEKEFQYWVKKEHKTEYASLLGNLNMVYLKMKKPTQDFAYFYESLYAIEAVKSVGKFSPLIEKYKSGQKEPKNYKEEILKLKKSAKAFFKNYSQTLDKEIFMAMMKEYARMVKKEDMPDFVRASIVSFEKNPEKFTNKVYSKSIFVDKKKLNSFLDGFSPKDIKKINNDFFIKMRLSLITDYRENIYPIQKTLDEESNQLMRMYMKAQMEMQKNKLFYPDANFSLRVSYGKVKGAEPADGKIYKPFTTLKGIMEKENPDIFDYVVEPKLKELYQNKDYGQYADRDGSLHVGFIATNHTTGGNSGSPVLDAYGNLIGINFDRQWEGTMSDLSYDAEICRNITLDIRYCLFLIDKYAGAGWLVDEMTLIK